MPGPQLAQPCFKYVTPTLGLRCSICKMRRLDKLTLWNPPGSERL